MKSTKKLSNLVKRLVLNKIFWFMFLGIAIPSSFILSGPRYVTVKKCAKCHRAIYNEWKLSRHARSWNSKFFQAKSKSVGTNCMLGCHAPQTVVNRDHLSIIGTPRKKKKNEGVSCFSCHAGSLEQQLTMHGPLKNAKSDYHDTMFDAKFAHTNACIPCHQYLEVYDQYNSLKKSGAKDKRCQDCHMKPTTRVVGVDGPIRKNVSTHRFRGAYDKKLVRKSIAMRLKTTSGKYVFEVENIGGGHQIPGGIWRTLVIKIVEYNSKKKEVAKKYYEFGIKKNNTLLYKKPQRFNGKLKSKKGYVAAFMMLKMLPNDTEPYYRKIKKKRIAF